MATPNPTPLVDAARDNWVDSYAPEFAKPYLKIARFDRPIGTWLLLFPCWWGQLLAHLGQGEAWINLYYVVLFAIGALAMRGAGCAWNDIVDRDIDAKVARTAARPIPSGQLSREQAFAFAVALSLIGFMILIQFNWLTIGVGIASLLLVAAYPFAKRQTYWPQLVLGLTFNWGILVGWTAVANDLALPQLLLYVGAICWTIAYDTIYAHQDAEDDALVGLGSTALLFGPSTARWLVVFYAVAVAFWLAAGIFVGAQGPFFVGLVAIAAHFGWQVWTLDTADAANCLVRFRSNRSVGWLMVAGMTAEIVLLLF